MRRERRVLELEGGKTKQRTRPSCARCPTLVRHLMLDSARLLSLPDGDPSPLSLSFRPVPDCLLVMQRHWTEIPVPGGSGGDERGRSVLSSSALLSRPRPPRKPQPCEDVAGRPSQLHVSSFRPSNPSALLEQAHRSALRHWYHSAYSFSLAQVLLSDGSVRPFAISRAAVLQRQPADLPTARSLSAHLATHPLSRQQSPHRSSG